MMVRSTTPLALLVLAATSLAVSPAWGGGAVHGMDRRSTVHPGPSKHSAPSHKSSRDRYHGDRHSGSHHGHYDKHHKHHSHCGHHGYDDHYKYGHGYYGRHYWPSFSLRHSIPSYHRHYVGCGHVAYYCDRCHFHTTSIEIFSDHAHLAHHVTFSALPGLLTWSPLNLTFVFD